MTETADPFLRDLFPELRRLGYTEGQNLVVERWSAAGRRESYPDVARQVVRSKPHVIFVSNGPSGTGGPSCDDDHSDRDHD